MPAKFAERWETAKTAFHATTGVKKPQPKGFFAAAFNYTDLSGSIEKCDKVLNELERAKPKDKPDLIKSSKKAHETASKAVKKYLDVLEEAADQEKADKAEKTTYYRAIKTLKAELEAIRVGIDQFIDQQQVALEGGGGMVQAAKLMAKGLEKSCADAIVAAKKIKLDPTPATYNQLMASAANTPGRKVQIQLQTAARMQGAGELTHRFSVDPNHVAEMFNPWQGQNSANSRVADDATAEDVLGLLSEFTKALKLAVRFSDEVKQLKD